MRLSFVLLLLLSFATQVARAQSGEESVESFNRAFHDATLHMDNAATLALWADDGISLLPSTKPVVGKPAIAAFLTRVTSALTGARMEHFELGCHDIEVSGDWASEWCVEHQVVQLGGGKPPFDGWGRMLLVLHRERDGRWLLKREMWIQATAADASPDSRAP